MEPTRGLRESTILIRNMQSLSENNEARRNPSRIAGRKGAINCLQPKSAYCSKKSTFAETSINKKALHDYEVLNKLEAGLVLEGHEVKSIRNGGANLKGSYISIKNGIVYTQNLSISKYKYASIKDYDPVRPRKLLLSKKEIEYLASQESQKGVTIIPLDIHFKNNFAKLTIGICKGKKLYDKRTTLRKKADDIEIKRALKKFNR